MDRAQGSNRGAESTSARLMDYEFLLGPRSLSLALCSSGPSRSARVLVRAVDGRSAISFRVRLAIHYHFAIGLRRPKPRWLSIGLGRPDAVRDRWPVLDGGTSSGFQRRRRAAKVGDLGSRVRLLLHGQLCLVTRRVSSRAEGPRFLGGIGIPRIMCWNPPADLPCDPTQSSAARPRFPWRSPPPRRVAGQRCGVANPDRGNHAGVPLPCATGSAVGWSRMACTGSAGLPELRLLGMGHLRHFFRLLRGPVSGDDDAPRDH